MIRACILLDFDTNDPAEAYRFVQEILGPDHNPRLLHPRLEGWESSDTDWFDASGNAMTVEEVQDARAKYFDEHG